MLQAHSLYVTVQLPKDFPVRTALKEIVGDLGLQRRIINNIVLHRDDVVILDMEAGLEHFGRGTTEGMDMFLAVIEPGARSIQIYKNVKRLANELGVRKVWVIANKIRNEKDVVFVKSKVPQEDLLGFVYYDQEVMDADREGVSPYGYSKRATDEITRLKHKMDGEKY